jgi:hypothetical protein
MIRRRVRSFALTASGLVLLGTASTMLLTPTARAATGSPQDFLSLGLFAEAGGERVVFTQKATTQPDGFAEEDVPSAHTELYTAQSYALTSAAWPGTGVGNVGPFLVLVGAGSQFEPLKDPVRAEAFSNQGPGTVTQAYPSATTPGITMTASAVPTKSTAHSEMAGSKNAAVGNFGATEASTESSITGKAAARSTASSVVKNLLIGPGGLISIASVVSTATVAVTASASGTSTIPSGGTTVEGMKVAGFPVTVDESGVHAQGHGTSAAAANAAINTALAQTQTQIFLAQPTTTQSSSGMTYDAGAVYISLGDGNAYIKLGGATAIAGASNVTTYVPPAGPPNLQVPVAPPTAVTPAGPTLSSTNAAVPTNTAPAPQTAPPPSGPFVTASAHFPGGAIAPGWLVLALLGAGLIALGLWRLPDKLLQETPTPCPLGEST